MARGTRIRPAFITPRWPNPGEGDFAADAEAFVLSTMRFYASRAGWHRRFYRLSGILVIVVGAALPLLTSLDFAGKNLAISLAGAAVAITTALRAFYRWDTSWVLLRRTELELFQAYFAWKAEPAADRNQAARDLIDRIYAIRWAESVQFFKNLPEPAKAADYSSVTGFAGRNPVA